MLRRMSERVACEESGFTLIELMITILIIGLLAAIAIALYLGQVKRADDADAKSNAKNLATEVELCFTPAEDFTQCDTPAKLGDNLEVPYGTNPGEAYIVNATKQSFVVEAVSKSTSNGVPHTYTVERDIAGITKQTCTAGAGNNAGGCKNGVW
jgi:prepilin-type N-terminal cleavage/methylation domain-containing protein